MPKKTKKEKLLALYHRKIRLLENKHTGIPITPPISIFPEPKLMIKQKAKVETMPVNQYFFSDLKKSLILIILIIGLEVSLYFVKLIK
ncbi:MAG: hypothetical protein AAB437_04060 [Patescibacteria group bacterium]